jgi:signal transduction histidine kinase
MDGTHPHSNPRQAGQLPGPLRPARPGRALYGRLERLSLAAGGLLMLAVVLASVLIAQRTGRDTADAAHAQQVRLTTVDLLDAVLLAETGQRGYLLTGRSDYLAPYSQAVHDVPVLLGRLGQDLEGDPDFANWRGVIQDKMAELAQTVRLEQAGRHQEALALVGTDRGRDDMARARDIARRLAEREAAAVSSDLRRSERGAQTVVAVDGVALVLLLALALFVGRSLRRTVRALNQNRRALVAANAELQEGRDRLEAAVRERTADLTEANVEIQRFAYIVSHDLRAPLLNIIGFTSELQDATLRLNRFVTEHLEPSGIAVPADVREASQADLPEAIRFIQTSTAKMDRLITAILRLSREGRRVLAPERLDMNALLGGIADSVRQVAEAAGAEVVVQSVPALVSDRLAVEQVFSNLVENALKYSAPGRPGRVTLSGTSEGAFMRYDVTDNGRGIAARDLERVFELFRRAGLQDKPGEGIGLAHVRALLRRLGGTVHCESTPGVGSTFIVRLPQVLVHTGEKTTGETTNERSSRDDPAD